MAETVGNTMEELKLSESKDTSKSEDSLSSLDISKDGKNAKQIKCQRCPSTILIPGSANLVTHKFKLPDPQQKDEKESSVSTNQYWCVDNMYAFENVGFSKTVDGVKYLICADCESGPIGWHDLDTKLSYVSLSKINYC